MKLLVIGGTQFVGRHLVQAALARGDQVTLFNRGQTATAPPGVEWRQGDRRSDLSALAMGEWDAVVDACGYLPAEVAGLKSRPLHDTVADTLAWWRSLPADQRLFSKAGLTPEREAAVLKSIAG